MCRSLFQQMQLANSAGDPPKRKCGSLHAPICSRGLDDEDGGLRGRGKKRAWNGLTLVRPTGVGGGCTLVGRESEQRRDTQTEAERARKIAKACPSFWRD